MLRTLKLTVAISAALLFAGASYVEAKNECTAPTATPRNQQVRIVHEGVLSVLVEYSTTDWFCKGRNCSERGTVTYHTTQIDLRGKANPYYFTAAAGPKEVSKVADAEVIQFRCVY